jgi:hypothetical protein
MCEVIHEGYTALDAAMIGLLTFAVASATHIAVTRVRNLAAQLRLFRAATYC